MSTAPLLTVFFPASFCGCYRSFFISLALICPLCVLCLPIHLHICLTSQKQFCFKSSLHSHFSQFTEFLSPSPSFCVVSSSLQLGLKSLFRWDITTHELKGGNSTVVALYWECPAAGVKTITIVRYPEAKRVSRGSTSTCAAVKTIAVGRYQEAK